MEGKKEAIPKKVRPYRLDYRPLIDRDLTSSTANPGSGPARSSQAKASTWSW
jgi:hypothetical protein